MWLYRHIGEDPYILAIAGDKVRNLFKISAVIFSVNLLLSIVSFGYMYMTIFHSFLGSFFLAVFTAFVINNVYKLCLITIVTSTHKKTLGHVISFLYRAIFIASVGLLLAQGTLIGVYDVCIAPIDFDTVSILDLVKNVLNENASIRGLEFFVVALYMVPFLIKYTIKRTSIFSTETHKITRAMILDEYDAFVMRYKAIFKQHFNLTLAPKAAYLDPPFNTVIPKTEKEVLGTNKDLRRYL